MVTLADIAARAGVSVFTVSCAVRGRGRVAAGTAERVRALATELGYVPSAAARALAEGRRRAKGKTASPALAVVRFGEKTPTQSARQKKDNQRMVALAQAQGYALKVVNLADFPTPARMCRVLWAQGVQGLILLTGAAEPGFGMKDLAGMEWERFALVRISRGVDDLRCHTVRGSPFSETKYALERIVAAGYRRIGVIMLTRSASAEDDYGRLGALRAFEDLHVDAYDWMEILRFDKNPGMLPELARAWLEEHRPDVVLGFPVVWRVWMEMAGYRIPQDFAFVGLPVQTAAESLSGVSTTGALSDFFTQDFPAALQMLHEQLASGRRGLPQQPYEHVLPVVWQEGVTMPVKA